MVMCSECSATPGYYIDQTKCERCDRRLIKRETHKKVLYRILELFKFHKHDWYLVNSANIKFRPHGEFTLALYLCKHEKCTAREWSISGQIEQIENFEREHDLI